MPEIPCIADYMTRDPVCFTPDMDVVAAMKILLERRFSGAPVVDAQGELIGVLSKKDCFKAALNASYHHQWGGAVADYMTRQVEVLEPNIALVQAAERFFASPYRRFPVVEEGRLVGQISRADLLRALSEYWGQ